MKPHNLFNKDDRGVSPVIGVILMVAITVILAAVIGTFVLGLGDSLGDSQPTVQLDVSYDTSANNVTIEHAGGDRIESDTLRVIVSDADSSTSTEGTIGTPLTVGDSIEGNLSAGGGGNAPTNLRVRIIHEPSDSILIDRTEEVNGDVDIDTDAIVFS